MLGRNEISSDNILLCYLLPVIILPERVCRNVVTAFQWNLRLILSAIPLVKFTLNFSKMAISLKTWVKPYWQGEYRFYFSQYSIFPLSKPSSKPAVRKQNNQTIATQRNEVSSSLHTFVRSDSSYTVSHLSA